MRMSIGALVVCCGVVGAGVVHAQAVAPKPRYSGRLVIDVLQDLNRQGLRIVFSTVIVKPTLRVVAEPSGSLPLEVLAQVLRPHGLIAEHRANGLLVVARAPRAKPAPEPAVAAPPGTLRGRVVDAADEQPLVNALVVVQRPERRATTDNEGRFELEGLEPGVQQVYVSLVGYVLARPEIAIPADGAVELLVTLTAGAGAYTESLRVVAEPGAADPAAASEFRVGSAELQELRGVLAEDPLRALQSMPAAATGDDFRSEFSVRGSAPRQMGFALDGVPVPWLVHQVFGVEDTGSIATINADVLEGVTLTAGAGPQLYGNRTGAWVDMVMREGSRDAFRATGSLSATGASAVIEGPVGRARRGAWLVSARQSYIDWMIRRLDPEESTTFGFSDVQSKLVVDLTPRHQFQVTTVGGRSTLREEDESPAPNGTAIGRSVTGLTIASWRATVGTSLLLTQHAAVSGYRFRNSNAFDQEVAAGRAWAWTYRSEAEWAPARAIAIRGTVNVDRDSFTFREQRHSSQGGALPVLRSWSIGDLGRWRQGAALGFRVRAPKTVHLDAGARIDRDGVLQDSIWSPWFVVQWRSDTRWTIIAAAGAAAQVPELSQIAVARETLRPERARYLDVSAGYQLAPTLHLHVAMFDRRETDGLSLDAPAARLVGGVPTVPFASGLWSNTRSVRARGVEAYLRRTSTRGLGGWISYAYGRTEDTDRVIDERYWGDFDQRHGLNVYGMYRLATRTSVSLRYRFGTNMPVPGYFAKTNDRLVLGITRNALRLPTYSRLDLRATRTYDLRKRRLTLFAEVINVFNRENVGLTDGTVRWDASVTGFVEKLFPVLPSIGLRVEF